MWGLPLSNPTGLEGRPLERIRALSGLAIQTPVSSKSPILTGVGSLSSEGQRQLGWGALSGITEKSGSVFLAQWQCDWGNSCCITHVGQGHSYKSVSRGWAVFFLLEQTAIEQPGGIGVWGSHTEPLRIGNLESDPREHFSPSALGFPL